MKKIAAAIPLALTFCSFFILAFSSNEVGATQRMVTGRFVDIDFTEISEASTPFSLAPKLIAASKMPELESFFRYQEPWLGSDAAYSLDISEFHPNTILWTFGDTLWGRIENETKLVTNMTNNSIALYDIENGTIEFYHEEQKNVFEMAEWVEAEWPWGPWAFAPFIQNGKIYWFLMVIDFAGWTDPIGDWLADIYLAEVNNPKDNPEDWNVNYYPIDFLPVKYENHSFLWLATDVYVEDNTYYMYGVKQEQVYDEKGEQKIIRHYVVARTQENITNSDSWEFYDGENWTSTPQIVKNGPSDLSTEYSVDYLPPFDKYLLIYQNDQAEDRLLGSSIWGRWSDTPIGPWSEPQILYTPPELDWNENYWAYAIKAHYPYLSKTDKEVVVSYVLSSYNQGDVFSNPMIYCPYFVKLILSKPFDLTQEYLESKLRYTANFIQEVSRMLDEAEARGFYVLEEKRSLGEAELLLESSKVALANGAFDECYADLQEAYLIASDVKDRINQIYAAGVNTVAMIPFLAVNALAVAFLLFESGPLKIISFLSIFTALLIAISFVYAGFKSLNPRLILVDCLLCVVGCLILPRLFKEGKGDRARLSFVGALASAFSIAKRNLRRRRLRTLLTLVSLLTLISGFIALTSFKLGQGFTANVVLGAAPSQGILIRKPAASTQFQPLNASILGWLSYREEIELVVPKAENLPSLYPVLTLSSPSGNKSVVWGVIGIVPSAESKTTFLNRTIKQGSFLRDEDSDGVLLSENNARELGVNLGDPIEISGSQFRLVGTFDASLLGSIRDLDGASVLPKKLVVTMVGITWSYCDPNDVAIFTFSSASKLPSMALARVDVLMENASDISPLARLIVLNWELEAWASFSDKVLHYYVGRYFEAKGSSLIVPFLLIIGNVFSLMINCVYERRKEIYTMSTLGLNPTHVALIFIAEGVLLGFITGGLGYILGLGSYRVMPLLPMPAEVTQKVSIEWSFLAVALSIITAVLGTTIPALRASILTTPSLTRKWRISEVVEKTDDYWKVHLPILIPQKEVDSLSKYLCTELRGLKNPIIHEVTNLKYREMEINGATEKRLIFTFAGYPEESPNRRVIADNEVMITRSEKKEVWTAYVLYYGSRVIDKRRFVQEDAHAMASLIRKIVLKWNALPQGRVKDREE